MEVAAVTKRKPGWLKLECHQEFINTCGGAPLSSLFAISFPLARFSGVCTTNAAMEGRNLNLLQTVKESSETERGVVPSCLVAFFRLILSSC